VQLLRAHLVRLPQILRLNYDARVNEVLPVTLRGARVFHGHRHVLLVLLAALLD
jgi:hypothetical protein